MKISVGLWKTEWRFLKNLKIDLPYDLAIPLLGIYPKEMKTGFLRHICTLVSVAALFTIAKYGYNRNACQWGNGKDVVYVCACVCVSCHLQQLCICVGLGQMMLGEMSQAETEKYCLISLMCGI